METTVEILKALSDKNRLRIIVALSRYEELCACQITEFLQVTGATVSRHLSLLQRAGLIESRKEGRWIYFKLSPTTDLESVLEWLYGRLVASEDVQSDLKKLDEIVEIDTEELCRTQRGEACCPR
jgi:ArsR family transcriptional regulator